jgi:MFS family permease
MALISSLKRRMHYGWVIFGLTFANLTIEGGAKNSQPVFLLALRNNFQTSATAVSAIFSVAGVVGALAAPILGRVLDRMGPRFLFPLAGVLILVGWLASSFATHIWQLFIFYGIIATVGQVSVASFTATANLAPWFPKSRGGVLGLADSGNSTGQAIVTPSAQLIVSTLGWRAAYQIFGVAFFLVVAPLNLLFQRRPPASHLRSSDDISESLEVRPVGVAAGEAPEEALAPPAAAETVQRLAEPADAAPRRWPMWLLFLSRATSATANQMTTLHIIAFFVLAGYAELQAAVTIGVVGFLSMAGRPVLGSLSDYLGRERVFTFAMAMYIGAVVVALVAGDGRSLWPLAIFAGLGGLSDGVSGLLIGAKAADLYPSRTLGSVAGMVEMGRGVGIALGPLLGGVLFDIHGDYVLAFSLAVSLTLVSVVFMWATRLVQGPERY